MLFRHLAEIWSQTCDKVYVFSSSNLVNLKTQLGKRGMTTTSSIQEVDQITKFHQFKLCLETKTTRPHNMWYDFANNLLQVFHTKLTDAIKNILTVNMITNFLVTGKEETY